MGRKTLRQLSDVLDPAGLGEEPIGAQPTGLSDVADFSAINEYDQKNAAKAGCARIQRRKLKPLFLAERT